VAVVTGVVLFVVGLFIVDIAWPKGFNVFIAISGGVGALFVLYEVRLTKQIAQAEFIRDLNDGFASDENVKELWRKLLLKEEIGPGDRHLVSSYLTFFETIHLLLVRGVLEFALIDDLFRNRFFTAIGNRGVQDTALIREAGAFTNIHDLIDYWHRYLLERGIAPHAGYYAYVRGVARAKGFEIRPVGPEDLGALEKLQRFVQEALPEQEWLRSNSADMLTECLEHHVALGAWRGDDLVAAGILYDAGAGSESIAKYLDDEKPLEESINLKLIMVSPAEQRSGLGRTLVELLEEVATDRGKARILCTIHPGNRPSQALFTSLGYVRERRVDTHYGPRHVFGRPLPSLVRAWAR
jgi:ribosomal protein S18 acetylase RimI-like enzyme